MSEHVDVVVVGARVAGSPLAALLARRGLRVAVLEQATFPRNTLSSHVIQSDSISFLDRLGVIDRIHGTQAPLTQCIDARVEDVRVVADIPRRPGDLGGGACIRRHILDPIVAEAAAEAGADVRMATKVTGLLKKDGRVVGVSATHNGTSFNIRARLVVGADGRGSTVAKHVGARQYNDIENQRAYYWTYFEGADISSSPTFVFHRWKDRFVIAAPADNGLYMVGVSPETAEREQFRRDLDGRLMNHALSCEPVARALARAQRASKIYGIVRFKSYFREAHGPGWVLVGDAGHFKDPAVGRGIGDAFLQVERLAPVIPSALDGPPEELRRALTSWASWRDREFAGHYWLGVDFGKAGAISPIFPEVVRLIHADGDTARFVELLSHRCRPRELLTPSVVMRATAHLLARRDSKRGAVLRTLASTGSDELYRRWIERQPRFARDGNHEQTQTSARRESRPVSMQAATLT